MSLPGSRALFWRSLTSDSAGSRIGQAMGRIRQAIHIDGRKCWTLFDTGARNTYVLPVVASLLVAKKLAKPFRAALGGEIKKTATVALLDAQVHGHKVVTNAMVIDDIGKDADGKPIEILF